MIKTRASGCHAIFTAWIFREQQRAVNGSSLWSEYTVHVWPDTWYVQINKQYSNWSINTANILILRFVTIYNLYSSSAVQTWGFCILFRKITAKSLNFRQPEQQTRQILIESSFLFGIVTIFRQKKPAYCHWAHCWFFTSKCVTRNGVFWPLCHFCLGS